MYYLPILSGFSDVFKNTTVAVDFRFPIGRYPTLSLQPILRHLNVTNPSVPGANYNAATISLPTINTIRRVFQMKADLFILIEFTPISLLGFLVAKCKQRPILLLIENDPRFRGGANGRFAIKVKSFFARRASRVMTNNRFGREFLIQQLRVSEDKIITAPYLTSDPKFFIPQSGIENSNGLRRMPGRINVLYLNSVTKRKGLMQLAAAVAGLPPSSRNKYCFHIVGTGDEVESIARYLGEKNIADLFFFYGSVAFTATWKYYEGADLFISPTLEDYRSLTGFEALNAGKPIIMSKFDGAHGEVVVEGKNGWTVDPTDLLAFRQVLEKVILEQENLGRFSQYSTNMSTNYTFEKIVSNLVEAAKVTLVG
jgi:glycosyltransferase involved in cell wall biosynthesis